MFMPPSRPTLRFVLANLCFLFLGLMALCSAPSLVAESPHGAPPSAASQANPPESTEIMPLAEVRPGMAGYAYTIFAGDQIEKFDLVVLGVLDNFLGPRQSIILVQLKGEKVEHTGVVAGMSGSPVYIQGKLAGALSLKLGVFTKEPIGGVTPIQAVMDPLSTTKDSSDASSQAFTLPPQMSGNGLPSGAALEPIETPLVFSGFSAGSMAPFRSQIQGLGFVAAQGGSTPPRSDDAHLVAGYRAASAYVHPALVEGFGLPMLEATVLGTPVIASSSAVPSIVAPYARTFAPHDTLALRAALTDLAANPAPYRRRAAEGSVALRAYTWDRFAAGTAAVYREVVDGSSDA